MNPNLAGLFAIAIFSIGTLLIALLKEIPSFQLGFISFTLGAFSIMAFEKIQGKNLVDAWKQPLSHYIFVTLGIGGYTTLLLISFKGAPAFEVNILNYLWPLLLTLFSGLLYKQSLKPVQIAGILLGCIGAFLLFLPSGGEGIFTNLKPGHGFAILAAFVWAFYSARARVKHYPVSLVAPAMLISALFCLICHLIFEETVFPPWQTGIVILLFGITRFCYALWDFGIRRGNQMLLASLAYFVPLLSTALFVLFGFAPSSPLIGLGGALIILGCLIVNSAQLKNLVRK